MKIKSMAGAAIATLLSLSSGTIAIAQTRPAASVPWFNCLTREVWSPQKQAWCRKLNQLQNAAYTLPDIGTVQLTQGAYKNQQTQVSVNLVTQQGMVQFGDLNGDGKEDALAILTANTGGSGVFIYLVAALNQDDRLQPTAPVFLDDRAQIKSMAIESGKVRINLVTHAPNDPMCCPTLNVIRIYALGYQLVQEDEVSANNSTSIELAPADPANLTEADRANYRQINLSELEPTDRSGQDPQAMALTAFGIKEEPEGNFEQTVRYKENGMRASVLITQIGLPDDSVRGVRYWVEFARAADAPHPQWQMSWAGRQQICQPGRGSQTWTMEICH